MRSKLPIILWACKALDAMKSGICRLPVRPLNVLFDQELTSTAFWNPAHILEEFVVQLLILAEKLKC